MLKKTLDGALEGPPKLGKLFQPFKTEYGTCDVHGQFVKREEVAGVVYAHPDGCPHCRRERATKALLDGCNVPSRFSDATFDNYEATTGQQRLVLDACRDYAANFRQYRALGRGLILCGNPGTGKNHLSTALFKALLAARFTVLRVKASEFLEAFWAKEFNERDAWVRKVAQVDLLMIDEVGRASSGQNAQNVFFRLIDARYENMLPTLLCTNLDREGLIETLGQAAYDRLTQGGTKRYTMRWESYRAKAHLGGEA